MDLKKSVKPVDLMEPLLDIVKTLQISCIIHNNNSMSSSVVTGCDGSESFLTGSVPLRDKQHVIQIKPKYKKQNLQSEVLWSWHPSRLCEFSENTNVNNNNRQQLE